MVRPTSLLLPPSQPQQSPSLIRRFRGLAACAGVALAIAAERAFKRAGTAVLPFTEPSAVVTTGPFAFSRNPMYLGMMLCLVGWAILLGSLVPVSSSPRTLPSSIAGSCCARSRSWPSGSARPTMPIGGACGAGCKDDGGCRDCAGRQGSVATSDKHPAQGEPDPD